MNRRAALSSAALMLAVLANVQTPFTRAHEIDAPAQPVVQVALLLDTSNSMDGLIDQARTQLWKIVNQFNHTKKHGVAPKLQVALYEYGNNGLAAGEGYVRMVLPLTSDLDLVSEKLWSLKTNGGSEYCGHVIKNAAAELDWAKDAGTYRAIFIAGNEPFTQGSVDYRSSCAAALAKGVIVNTIHCGPEHVGREGKWSDGAKLGEGKFLNIDQDKAVVAIATPHDDELAKLSSDLNKTYVPYGDKGKLGAARQNDQDLAAASQPASGAMYERAEAKASGNYSNAGWDLVDAVIKEKLELAKVPEKELPAEMQTMSADERKAYVDEQAAKRTDIQKKIAETSAARAKYVEENRKANAGGADTLDSAVLKAVEEQLRAKDYVTE